MVCQVARGSQFRTSGVGILQKDEVIRFSCRHEDSSLQKQVRSQLACLPEFQLIFRFRADHTLLTSKFLAQTRSRPLFNSVSILLINLILQFHINTHPYPPYLTVKPLNVKTGLTVLAFLFVMQTKIFTNLDGVLQREDKRRPQWKPD
ncbi:hypothetical protein T08_15755 [Trichinella sp. T8]|nr:hypothetical protein T08_15755 [Trichinella sp. T8]